MSFYYLLDILDMYNGDAARNQSGTDPCRFLPELPSPLVSQPVTMNRVTVSKSQENNKKSYHGKNGSRFFIILVKII